VKLTEAEKATSSAYVGYEAEKGYVGERGTEEEFAFHLAAHSVIEESSPATAPRRSTRWRRVPLRQVAAGWWLRIATSGLGMSRKLQEASTSSPGLIAIVTVFFIVFFFLP